MSKLIELIEEAEKLREKDQKNADIAEALLLEANRHYGAECRNSEFMAALQLAKAVDEMIYKDWNQKI